MRFRKFPFALVPFLLGSLSAQISITGPAVPELAVYDQIVTGIMAKYSIPAAQFAITRQGKLLLAHGYGTLDPGGQTPVQPDSLFRLASLSKPLTAVAILRLWDQGKIDLDRSAFSYIPELQPLPGKQPDSRLSRITVRNLLQHSGGWDVDISADPFDQTVSIAQEVGKTPPASSEDIIRVMMGRPLDFDPGTRFAYSNFGYCVLGRIIERLSGMSYEQYVRTKILAPLGIEKMRTGNTLDAGRIPGETGYVSPANAPSVFPFGPKKVPLPYGGWYLEAMDANAGWVASVPDLLKFWNAIDGRLGGPLLSAAAIAELSARPNLPDWAGQTAWYGMGFRIVPTGSGAHWWHDGDLEGTRSLAVRTVNGYNWAILFDKEGSTNFISEADSAFWNALSHVKTWPATDLYPSFATPAVNRPAIQTQDGVVNGASFLRGFTAGSWASIFGVNLAGSTRSWASADFKGNSLPLALDGVSVKIGGQAAAVAYISPTQINVQIPAGLAAGAVTIEVVRNGQSSGPALGEVRTAAPALFTYNGPYAAAVFTDGTLVGTRPARPGDRVSLYGSNFESAAAGSVIRAAVPLAALPAVKVGGAAAKVEYAGLTGAGLYQVNIVVPDVPNGDQAVDLTYAGATTQKGVLLSIKK